MYVHNRPRGVIPGQPTKRFSDSLLQVEKFNDTIELRIQGSKMI